MMLLIEIIVVLLIFGFDRDPGRTALVDPAHFQKCDRGSHCSVFDPLAVVGHRVPGIAPGTRAPAVSVRMFLLLLALMIAGMLVLILEELGKL
jgi:hypothetical protein